MVLLWLPSILAFKHCLIFWEVPFRQLWKRKSSSQPLSILLLHYQDNAHSPKAWTLDSLPTMPCRNQAFLSFHGIGHTLSDCLTLSVFHCQITPSQEGRNSTMYQCQGSKNVHIFYFCIVHENFTIFDNLISWTINSYPQKCIKHNGEQWLSFI